VVAFCDEDELGAGDLFCRVSRVLDRDDSVVGAVGDEGGGGDGGERERREAGEGGFVVSPARPAILPRSDGSPLFLNALESGWVGCDPVDRRPLLFFVEAFGHAVNHEREHQRRFSAGDLIGKPDGKAGVQGRLSDPVDRGFVGLEDRGIKEERGGAVGISGGEVNGGWATGGETQDRGLCNVQCVKNRRVEVGLPLWTGTRLQGGPQVAGAGGGKNLAAAVSKMPAPGESLVESSWSAVDRKHWRTLALSRYLHFTLCCVEHGRTLVERDHHSVRPGHAAPAVAAFVCPSTVAEPAVAEGGAARGG